VHLDGAFLTTRGLSAAHVSLPQGGCILYTGSVHSEAGLCAQSAVRDSEARIAGAVRAVAKEGAPTVCRAHEFARALSRTPIWSRQIPEQAQILQLVPEW